MSEQERVAIHERHDHAVQDLIELDRQVASGQIAASSAANLRERYEGEAAAALAWLDAHPPADGVAEASDDADAPSVTEVHRSRRRRVLGGALAAVVLIGLGVTVVNAVGPRPAGGFTSGNEATAGGRDLSTVTTAEMARVVAENPDIVGMRLALAHRYLDDNQYDKATSEYLKVLDRADDPEAMSHLGWLLFLDGRISLAEQMLESSADRAPGDPETTWFLANLRLYGQHDPAAALPLLKSLLGRGDLGDQRAAVVAAIDDATSMAATDGP